MLGAKKRKIEEANPAADSNQASRLHISALKYYIHDGTEAFRFQLLGDLRDADVKELSGCWETARSTFGNRKLVLDLNGLRSTDEAGKEWLLAMIREAGAVCIPESYFRTNLAEQSSSTTQDTEKTSGLLNKLTSGLRGDREIPAGSPTQAP
jgi:hypothetical protein